MRALDVVAYQRHRLDLAQGKEDAPPCERPGVEGCPYLVEVGVELLKAERADLAAQIAKAFDLLGCDGALRFAVEHGLEALPRRARPVCGTVVNAALSLHRKRQPYRRGFLTSLFDDYFEFRDDMQVSCRHCGWAGPAGETILEMSSEVAPVLDRECPNCLHIVLVVPFPTFEQTRVAAEAGNEEAIRMCHVYDIAFTPPPRRPH
jgi:hypothetical protein